MILRMAKNLGVGLLYILSGIIVPGLFAGGLYVTGGVWGGYPVLGLVFMLAGLWFWFLYRKPVSVVGFAARCLPVVLGLGIAVWAMVPLTQYDFPDTGADDRFGFWDLGDGRVVAVAQFTPPEDISPRGKTLVFVHGGPGAYLRDFDLDFLSDFAAEGFEVLTYDQVGAGRSAIIDITGYSHTGNINDLRRVLDRIHTPVILMGQSYGAAIVTSYLAEFRDEHDIRQVIFSEPGPLPGSAYSISDSKTTKAENAEGMTITDVLRTPRIILAFLLPASNQFVPQEELLHFIGPDLQKAAVATSYCAQHADQMLPFEHHRINFLATKTIMRSFLEAETPDLTDLDRPVLMLLGECSYVPRHFALDYFNHFSISRSHLIREVGHILWATPEGRHLTRESILQFIDGTEPTLPNKPTAETREQFLEEGL